MAGDVDFRVDDAGFQRALRELAAATRKPYSEVVKANARLIAVNLAFQTQPFGASQRAKMQGQKAVWRDLRLVYASASSVFETISLIDEEMAKAFYRAMRKGDTAEAQRILGDSISRWRNVEIGPFDETHHKRSRNRRGRVSRHVPAQVITTGSRKYAAYAARKVRMVGFAKAGWAAAAQRLTGNTRGIPQFVTRHKNKSPGGARDNSNSTNNPHVILSNEVPYIHAACSPQQISAAFAIQREKMIASIQRVLDAQARRFNRS